MITIVYRNHTSGESDYSEVVVASDLQLVDLLDVFEHSDRVKEYALIDTDYLANGVQSLSYYGYNPDAFPKFKLLANF